MLQSHGTPDRLNRVATGASAEVYAWETGQVVKLFRRDFPREAIEVELRHARIAHGLGIPTPRVEGVVEMEGRMGIVFERCDGPTLYEAIQARSRSFDELARILLDLQQAIHRCQAPHLQLMAAKLARRIHYARDVPDSLKNEAIAAVQAAPAADTVCHGDFHPINVILTARGPVAIDWLDAARGDPAMDVTRTLLFLKYARPQQIDPGVRAQLVESYMRHCREAWAGRLDELQRWQFPVAVGRLSEGIEGQEREGLMRLVERTESLWH